MSGWSRGHLDSATASWTALACPVPLLFSRRKEPQAPGAFSQVVTYAGKMGAPTYYVQEVSRRCPWAANAFALTRKLRGVFPRSRRNPEAVAEQSGRAAILRSVAPTTPRLQALTTLCLTELTVDELEPSRPSDLVIQAGHRVNPSGSAASFFPMRAQFAHRGKRLPELQKILRITPQKCFPLLKSCV